MVNLSIKSLNYNFLFNFLKLEKKPTTPKTVQKGYLKCLTPGKPIINNQTSATICYANKLWYCGSVF